jgi:hypothetical protein
LDEDDLLASKGPVQPTVSVVEMGDILLKLNGRHWKEWTAQEKQEVGLFMRNRQAIDERDKAGIRAAGLSDAWEHWLKMYDDLLDHDKEFEKLVDPIMIIVEAIPGPATAYVTALNATNAFLGGVGAAGPVGQPLSFIRNNDRLLQVGSIVDGRRAVAYLQGALGQGFVASVVRYTAMYVN